MADLTRQNLENRQAVIASELGRLAYNRRDYQLKIEEIDRQVAAMEAQAVLIAATLQDLSTDAAAAKAKADQERADAKAKRSERAKGAAAKRKREKAKEEAAKPKRGKV